MMGKNVAKRLKNKATESVTGSSNFVDKFG